jgi:hypothetical protein
MRIAQFRAPNGQMREAEVPETWDEAYGMLKNCMDPYNDSRGRNTTRVSIATRVAFGMFNNGLIPEPTIALIYLMMKICQRKGAGLDK